MLVSDESFEPMFCGAQEAVMEGAKVRVPSFQHLIALKAHALKNSKGLRVLKDMTDVAELLRANRHSADAEWLRDTFSKYGDQQSYERIRKLLT